MDEEKGQIAVLVSYVDERRWKAGFGDERGGKVGEERSFAVGIVRFGGSGEMEVGRLIGCEFKMVSRSFLLRSFDTSLRLGIFCLSTLLLFPRFFFISVVLNTRADSLSSFPRRSEHRPSASSSPVLHHPSLLEHRFHHPPLLHPRSLSVERRSSL